MSLSTRIIYCLMSFLLILGMSLPAQAEMELEPGTSVIFYHYDLLGSPVMASDHKGRTLWYENTKPYGESTGKVSPGGVRYRDNLFAESVSELGYTGHTQDRQTGLTYMKARHYDPVIGRFYSNDPVGIKIPHTMTFNRYSYANNNPLAFTDPNGEAVWFALAALPATEWALGALVGTTIGIGLYEYGSSILNNESEEYDVPDDWKDAAESQKSRQPSITEVPVSELNPLHSRDTVGERPDLKGLTDEELLGIANNPPDEREKMKINERGVLVDGNSRAYELIDRSNDPDSSITSDTRISVDNHDSGSGNSWWGSLWD